MKKCQFILLILVACLSIGSWAREKAESFLVYFLSDHVKVVSPDKKQENTHVIIENKTLSKLIGHIESPRGTIIEQVAIDSGKRASYSLIKARGDIFFIPLSPASQEVELLFGKAAYEIPAQNQD